MNRKQLITPLAFVLILILLLAACGGKTTQPKAGHWEGSDPDVSFNVTPEGQIVNFSMSAPYGSSACDIRVASVTLPEKTTLVMDLTSTETLSVGFVTGEFGAEKINGKYKIEMCNMNISLGPDDDKEQGWQAEWKNP